MSRLAARCLVVLSLASVLAGCGQQQCLAVPVCESNEAQSNTACGSGETSCRKVEICGSTIYCRPGTADAGP